MESFQPHHDYLIALDSDGCVLDTMELKHKECFVPNLIAHYHLQAASRWVREVYEWVHLYSRHRGLNRFPGLLVVFAELARHPRVRARGVALPDLAALAEWLDREPGPSIPKLAAEWERNHAPELKRAMDWSIAVDACHARMVRHCAPFACVRESIAELNRWADVVVCSTAPHEELAREWGEHGLDTQVRALAGQEAGGKRDLIAGFMRHGYAPERVLMLGDSPFDQRAAHANGARFYPITPGREDDCWQRFLCEAAARFHAGRYTAEYEAELAAAFEAALPATPPWAG
jgi:phosphoglycolate phosphatase-like HAD superfamily hydrolase